MIKAFQQPQFLERQITQITIEDNSDNSSEDSKSERKYKKPKKINKKILAIKFDDYEKKNNQKNLMNKFNYNQSLLTSNNKSSAKSAKSLFDLPHIEEEKTKNERQLKNVFDILHSPMWQQYIEFNQGPQYDYQGKLIKHSIVGNENEFLATQKFREEEAKKMWKQQTRKQVSTFLTKKSTKDSSILINVQNEQINNKQQLQQQEQQMSQQIKPDSELTQSQNLKSRSHRFSILHTIQREVTKNKKEQATESSPTHQQKQMQSLEIPQAIQQKQQPQQGLQALKKKKKKFDEDENIKIMTKQDILNQMKNIEQTKLQAEMQEQDNAMKDLPLYQQNLLTKDERSLQHFENYQKQWEKNSQMLYDKVKRNDFNFPLMLTQENFRKRLETNESFQILKENAGKVNQTQLWHLMLRSGDHPQTKDTFINKKGKKIFVEPHLMPHKDKNLQDVFCGNAIKIIDPQKQVEIIQKPSDLKEKLQFKNTQQHTGNFDTNNHRQETTDSHYHNLSGNQNQFYSFFGSYMNNNTTTNLNHGMSRLQTQGSHKSRKSENCDSKFVLATESDLDGLIVQGQSVYNKELEMVKKDGNPDFQIYKVLKNKDVGINSGDRRVVYYDQQVTENQQMEVNQNNNNNRNPNPNHNIPGVKILQNLIKMPTKLITDSNSKQNNSQQEYNIGLNTSNSQQSSQPAMNQVGHKKMKSEASFQLKDRITDRNTSLQSQNLLKFNTIQIRKMNNNNGTQIQSFGSDSQQNNNQKLMRIGSAMKNSQSMINNQSIQQKEEILVQNYDVKSLTKSGAHFYQNYFHLKNN